MLFTDCFLRFPTSRSFGFIHTITNFSSYLYVLYNIFLSASVSETIGEQSQYVKNKAFNDQYYRDLIVKYLEQYGSAKKRDVRELLIHRTFLITIKMIKERQWKSIASFQYTTKLSEINTRFIERYYQSLLKRRAVIK